MKLLTLLGLVACSKMLAADPYDLSSVTIEVVTLDGSPIKGARIEVLRWTGQWTPTQATFQTDASGHVVIGELRSAEHLNLLVRADGFAQTMQSLEFNAPEHRNLKLKLSRPAKCWLNVVTEDGRPIIGAELQRLDFTDTNGNKVIVIQKGQFNFETDPKSFTTLPTSQSNGRLNLPLIPEGSSITAWVIHKDWKLAKHQLRNVKSGSLLEVKLSRGVPVRIKLHSNSVSHEELEGQSLEVLLMPRSGGSSSVECVRHSFPILNSAVEFNAHPVEYSYLDFRLKDYFTSPDYQNRPMQPNSMLNFTEKVLAEFSVHALRKVKAKGQIVNANGHSIAGVSVTGYIAKHPAAPNEKSMASSVKWNIAGNAQSNHRGYYEIEVAAGKSAVGFFKPGFFSTPSQIEFDTAADGSTTIPNSVMRPIPILRGKVVSDEGKPIAAAIVRMRSIGVGDINPIVQTNELGEFELRLSRIPNAPRGTSGHQTDVFVVAFDPNSNLAGRTAVDLKDQKSTDIKVTLEPQVPNWILKPLADQHISKVTPHQKVAFDNGTKELAIKYPAGAPGQPIPSLKHGTWLNTNASSLSNFRGKFVLLDFWFIGCGPCHRDMPSVKLAHESFRNQGFSVVSVHNNSQTAEKVRQFAESNAMSYPIVVDDAAGHIMEKFAKLGIFSYPSYLLVDPDGNILLNDRIRQSDAPLLRRDKIEVIYSLLRTQKH